MGVDRTVVGRGLRAVRLWVEESPRAAAVLAGVLLALSFPPFDQPWLQIPAWVLLLRVVRMSANAREATIRAYSAALTWNLGATYWLMMATVSGGVAAIVTNALLMVLPLLAIREVQRSGWPAAVHAMAIAGLWTAFEFGHHHWPLSWPWLTLANAWSVWPGVIQWIEWTGHLGVSIWVVAVAALLELAWHGIWETGGNGGFGGDGEVGEMGEVGAKGEVGEEKTVRWRTTGVGAAARIRGPVLLVVFPAILHLSLGWVGGSGLEGDGAGGGQEQVEEAGAVRVTVVQPNHDSLLPYGGHGNPQTLVDTLLAKSERALGEGSDLIIWPENAVDAALTIQSGLSRRLGQAAWRWNSALLTGMIAIETYAPGEAPLLHRGSAGQAPFNVYNSAVFYPGPATPPDGSPDPAPGVYHKANLVPVVERFPFVETLSRVPLLERLDWPSIMGYGQGERADVFTLASGVKTFGLICYDSVYPDWTRRFVLQGAGFITVITNDGWWGNTSGHVQHFEFARLRAIEFRRTVVRSANNGTSGVILPDGSVQVRTAYAAQDAFTARIRPREGLTFFARTGNWVGWGSAGIALAVAVALAAGRLGAAGGRRMRR